MDDKDSLWKKFTETGSVEDFLRYREEADKGVSE